MCSTLGSSVLRFVAEEQNKIAASGLACNLSSEQIRETYSVRVKELTTAGSDIRSAGRDAAEELRSYACGSWEFGKSVSNTTCLTAASISSAAYVVSSQRSMLCPSVFSVARY